MTTLVTGGAGYIGSHMVLALLDAGERVVVVDDLSTGNKCAVPEAAAMVVADMGDRSVIGDLIDSRGIDAVIHFAGSAIVPESVSDPLRYYHNNTIKSHVLLETLVAHGVRNLVFSSSAAVYGIPQSNPVNEGAPPRPISPYGSSKMMTEIMLRDVAAAHDLAFVALRYFNVAGADPAGRTGQSGQRATHLIKVACQTALGLRPQLEIYGSDFPTGDGTCVRDYIHVTDLVAAHMLALDHLRAGQDSVVLNCGYGRGFSVREVVDTVKRASGTGFEIRMADRRPGDPAELVADASLIRSIFGWQPSYDDLDRIVAHALAWEEHLLKTDVG